MMDINVRGINSKLEILINILHMLCIDILTIQETHVNGSSKIKIPGYYVFQQNRPKRGSKGGVAIAVREILKDQAVLIHESSQCEFIAVKLCNMRPNVCILNYYAKQENVTPPNVIHEHLSEVFGLATRLTDEGHAVYTIADWNIGIGNLVLSDNCPTITRGGKVFNDLMLANPEFELLNSRYHGSSVTHIDASGGKGKCLDMVIANAAAAGSVTGFIVDETKLATPYRYFHKTGTRRYTDHLALIWEAEWQEKYQDVSDKYTLWNFSKKLGDGKFAYTLERGVNGLIMALNTEKDDINNLIKRVLSDKENAMHRGYGKRLVEAAKWKHLEDERIELYRLEEIEKAVNKARETSKSARVPLHIFQMRKSHTLAERGEVISSVIHPETGRVVETKAEIDQAIRRHNEINLDQYDDQPEPYKEHMRFKLEYIEMAKLQDENERASTLQFEDFLDCLKMLVGKNKNCYSEMKKWGPKYTIFIYWLMKRIYESEEIPDLFLKTSLQALYKNKGSRKDLGNYRFLHLKDGLAKMFEALVMMKCKKDMWDDFPESQIGGLPNSRTTEHLYVIVTLMAMCEWKAEWSPKGVVIIFKDVRKAFDRCSAIHTVYSAAKAGVSGRPLRILEKLNKRTVFEVVGDDSKTEFVREWAGAQGTIFTATACSKAMPEPMHDLIKAWETDTGMELGVRLGPDKVMVSEADFVDDESALCNSAEAARVKGNLITRASEHLNVKVHPQKTKILVVGEKRWKEETLKDLETNPVMIAGEKVEMSDSERYLGMMINENGLKATVEQQMKFRISECNAKISQIMILLEKPTMLSFGYLAGLRTLFDSVMSATALYSSSCWAGMTAKDYEWIDKEQKRLLFTMLRINSKTTVKHVLHELGLIQWSWLVKKEKISLVSFLCQGKEGQASRVCLSEAKANLKKGLVFEARKIASEVGLPDPTTVLISAETASEAITTAARTELWESVMSSKWVHVMVRSTRYKPDYYIYETEWSGYQQKLWMAYRLGILLFKRRYAGRFNNVECIWDQCSNDDTLEHSLVCPYYDLERPEDTEHIGQMIPFLEKLSKVREAVIGHGLFAL